MKWLLGICVVLFSACQQEEKPKELTGHWHVYFNPDSSNIYEGYEFINFKDSTFSEGFDDRFITEEFGDRYWGRADFVNQTLNFDQVDGPLEGLYRYKFNKDSLFLNWIYDKSEDKNERYLLYALKIDKGKCPQYEYLFQFSELDTDLPKTKNSNGLNRLSKRTLQNAIQIGYLKSDKAKELISVRQIEVWGKEYNVDEIPIDIKKHRGKVPYNQVAGIRYTIYADKKTKVKHLKPILQKLAEITDRPKVVLVFQYNPQPDDFKLFGKEVIFEGVDWTDVEDEMLFADYVLGQN